MRATPAVLMLLAMASMPATAAEPPPDSGGSWDPPEPDLQSPAAVRQEIDALAGMVAPKIPGGCEGVLLEAGDVWIVRLQRNSDGGMLAEAKAPTPRDAMNALMKALLDNGKSQLASKGLVCPVCEREIPSGRYCQGHGHHARGVPAGRR